MCHLSFHQTDELVRLEEEEGIELAERDKIVILLFGCQTIDFLAHLAVQPQNCYSSQLWQFSLHRRCYRQRL